MGDKTGISWTDATWNPIRGCSKVSEGCRNCYAMSVAYRFSGKGQPYEGLAKLTNGQPNWTGKIVEVPTHLEDPLHWQKPRRVFVNSMSDLFHEQVSEAYIHRVFTIMRRCPQHTFQILTKRPARMRDVVSHLSWMTHPDGGYGFVAYRGTPGARPLPNVWLGTSVEDQAAAADRIPPLLETPAAVRFLSCEPLIGPLALPYDWLAGPLVPHDPGPQRDGNWWVRGEPRIHWVIVGGESHRTDARLMRGEWVQSLRNACHAAGTAFFFKQTGTALAGACNLRAHKGDDPTEWPEEFRVQEWPGVVS